MKIAAIYARVSSDQQKEENTIASQTAVLVEFAREQGFSVPDEWVIEDEGFSGASLLRPGLERLRDLATEGQIQAVLIHSPDRLSRKYAYQVLLIEEFARHGVETIFIRAPHGGTPEDQLMLQFQGMIAEYERAQILERSRRGKRHRAKAGEVSVLGGAPYGYRYIRKTTETPARYEIDAAEAAVVRLVFEKYTVDGLSIGAIVRLLREMGPPTRRRVTRWERSVVWGMLRNPAYKGTACFNKTQVGPRQKVTKPFRLSGRAVHGEKTSAHERPRDEWIEVPVPAIVSEETFALAAGRLADNKRFAPRRTIEPSPVQGLVSCRKCGYALYRTSTRTSARKIHYYRCLGSDGWRHHGGSVCDSRPIRQDLLDHIVWQEVMRLIEDPELITAELDRRLDAARASEPTKKRQDALERDLTRVSKSMERLVTAYQEDLLSLDELRCRMPELRARQQGLRAELQAIHSHAADRMSFLRLAETLTAFLQRLRQSAETLEISDRQRIVRLLVKEVLVDDDTVTIRHSIPAPPTTLSSGNEQPSSNGKLPAPDRSYLLRSGSERAALRRPLVHRTDQAIFHHPGLEKRPDELEHAFIGHPRGNTRHQAIVVDPVEEFLQIDVDHIAVTFGNIALRLGHCLVGGAPRSEAVTGLGKCRVPAPLENLQQSLLDQPVDDARHAELSDPAIRLGYFNPLDRLRLVGSPEQSRPNAWPILTQVILGIVDGHAIHARTALVPSNAFPRFFKILSVAHLLH
jgi:site-specific DNA recombinase